MGGRILCPVHFPKPRKLFPQLARRLTFQLSYHFADRILRWNNHHRVDVINLDVLLHDLASGHLSHQLRENFAQILRNARIQDAAAILRYPDNMVFGPINAVIGNSGFHPCILPRIASARHSPPRMRGELKAAIRMSKMIK